MSKTDIKGDAFLDRLWRTTRAPRRFPGDHDYMLGLDVLGALPISRTGILPKPPTLATRTSSPAPTPTPAPVVRTSAPAPATPTLTKTPVATVPPRTTALPRAPVETKTTLPPPRAPVETKRPSAVPPRETKRAPVPVETKKTQAVAKPSPAATARAKAGSNAAIAAANAAISAGGKFAKRRSKGGQKLVSVGKKLIARIRSTKLQGDIIIRPGDQQRQQELASGGSGDGGDAATVAIERTADVFMAVAGTLGVIARAVDAVNDRVIAIIDLIDRAGYTDLARSGDDIIARTEACIAQLSEDGMTTDPSVAYEAQALISDAQAWRQEADTALNTPPVEEPLMPEGPESFDPGSYGGGGGGGGGGSEGYEEPDMGMPPVEEPDPFATAEEFDDLPAASESSAPSPEDQGQPSDAEAGQMFSDMLEEGGYEPEAPEDDSEQLEPTAEPEATFATELDGLVIEAGIGATEDAPAKPGVKFFDAVKSLLERYQSSDAWLVVETRKAVQAVEETPPEDEYGAFYAAIVKLLDEHKKADQTAEILEEVLGVAAAATAMPQAQQMAMYDQIFQALAKDVGGITQSASGEKPARRDLTSDILNPLRLVSAAIEAGGDVDEALARYGLGGLTKEQKEAAAALAVLQLQQEQAAAQKPVLAPIKVDPTTAKRLALAQKRLAELERRKRELDAQAAAEKQQSVMGGIYGSGASVLGGW